MNVLWRLLAVLALLLAGLGTVLPVMPAVPFLLLAAAASARGWPWLAGRLRSHDALGPSIAGWQDRGALARPVKLASIGGLVVSTVLAWFAGTPAWAVAGLAIVVCAFAAWLWRRPEP